MDLTPFLNKIYKYETNAEGYIQEIDRDMIAGYIQSELHTIKLEELFQEYKKEVKSKGIKIRFDTVVISILKDSESAKLFKQLPETIHYKMDDDEKIDKYLIRNFLVSSDEMEEKYKLLSITNSLIKMKKNKSELFNHTLDFMDYEFSNPKYQEQSGINCSQILKILSKNYDNLKTNGTLAILYGYLERYLAIDINEIYKDNKLTEEFFYACVLLLHFTVHKNNYSDNAGNLAYKMINKFRQEFVWKNKDEKGVAFTKRVKSYFYKEYGIKLRDDFITMLGNKVASVCMPKDMYLIIGKFKNPEPPWDEFQMGQRDSSCYWGCRGESFSYFYDCNNIHFYIAVLDINQFNEAKQATIEKEIAELGYANRPTDWREAGIARCWLTLGTKENEIRFDKDFQGTFAIALWNHYGKGTRKKILNAFTRIFNIETPYIYDSKEVGNGVIEYIHCDYTDGTMWLNSPPAILSDAELKEFNCSNIKCEYSEREWDYYCEHCGNGLNDGDVYFEADTNEPLCEECFYDLTRECIKCGVRYYNTNTVLGEDNEYRCEGCHNAYQEELEEEQKRKEEEELNENKT